MFRDPEMMLPCEDEHKDDDLTRHQVERVLQRVNDAYPDQEDMFDERLSLYEVVLDFIGREKCADPRACALQALGAFELMEDTVG